MFKEQSINNSKIKLLGIKIIERTLENYNLFEREFINDEDEQAPIESGTCITWKIFNIPCYRAFGVTKYNDDLQNNTENKTSNSNLKTRIIVSFLCIFMVLSAFMIGIITANSSWFNNTFYIKSRQMQNLNIKSLKPFDRNINKTDISQYELNVACEEKYEHYHKYYEKVVERIKNLDFDDIERTEILKYLDGYESRKNNMIQMLFPRTEMKPDEGGYGSSIGSIYPTAMFEFDRQELLTYRMILENMYAFYNYAEIEEIFEE